MIEPSIVSSQINVTIDLLREEPDRQTDKHTYRYTQIDRQTDTHTDKHTQANRQIQTHLHRQTIRLHERSL